MEEWSGRNEIEVKDLYKHFTLKGKGGILQREHEKLKAVDGVSLDIYPHEIFGLVGETGCGKTTLGRLMIRLERPTSGAILYRGKDIAQLKGSGLIDFRRNAQMVFQDPYESLNPRATIESIVSEPLLNNKMVSSTSEARELVIKALTDAGLGRPEDYLGRYPNMLSGGERQRVSIARAVIINPTFVVADEVISMLDASIKVGIMDLIQRLRKQYEMAVLFITHDFSIARYICDRVGVMYLGKIVEIAETEVLIQNPLHPYMQVLKRAIPVADPTRERVPLPIKGELPSPINIPSGCRFRTRCLHATDLCKEKEPPLVNLGDMHYVACHYAPDVKL